MYGLKYTEGLGTSQPLRYARACALSGEGELDGKEDRLHSERQSKAGFLRHKKPPLLSTA